MYYICIRNVLHLYTVHPNSMHIGGLGKTCFRTITLDRGGWTAVKYDGKHFFTAILHTSRSKGQLRETLYLEKPDFVTSAINNVLEEGQWP